MRLLDVDRLGDVVLTDGADLERVCGKAEALRDERSSALLGRRVRAASELVLDTGAEGVKAGGRVVRLDDERTALDLVPAIYMFYQRGDIKTRPNHRHTRSVLALERPRSSGRAGRANDREVDRSEELLGEHGWQWTGGGETVQELQRLASEGG